MTLVSAPGRQSACQDTLDRRYCYCLTLEYVGTSFHGFQRQPGLATIHGALESAASTYTGTEVVARYAGRTDKGVHAVGQVAAFDLAREVDTDRALIGLNALLPDGIAVTALARAREGFDPRRDALWREYRYFILNRKSPSPILEERVFHVAKPLDLRMMEEACALFPGEHDFSAFRVKGGSDVSAVRNVLKCDVVRVSQDLLCIRVIANAFLYRMVRVMAGAIFSVGRGRMSLDDLRRHLDGSGKPCADPLPARGLYLWRVAYPDDIHEA
ncbi:MAG: tRNA pseudouridine(38-40) synthase TruA [Candidatus Anoxymicrobium japonicum]|uniref:tRNA pseudouridine synthase A n=1 Tax=Candidatus Anoxymicrobium japonicum TaxID=2013648 RepID=A0A2N3G7P8_9ACTN|nr:MAG: tRNA pseudouridine(38-40) synthase TruA [Candidatus Anoxymicrobium japonicum]